MKKEISQLFDAFEAASEELWIVGGFVRDLVRSRMGAFSVLVGSSEDELWADVEAGRKDVDFATSALPEKTMNILRQAGFPVIPIGVEFGTIQTHVGNFKTEITTYRCEESYKKGSRKPSVKFGKTIKEDLVRRDFTINAIAMDRNFVPYDPFNGREDIWEMLLRTPGNPHDAFMDDPLRMLRAARFIAKGYGAPDWIVKAAMKKLCKEIHNISKERIFEEMTKILMCETPRTGLNLLVNTGLMEEIFPEIQRMVDFQTKGRSKKLWEHILQVVEQAPLDPVIRWAAFMHDIGKPNSVREFDGKVTFRGHEAAGAEIWESIADRLRTSSDFKESVSVIIRESGNFVELKSVSNDLTNKGLRRFVRRVGSNLNNIFQFTLADMTSKHEWKIQKMRKETEDLKKRIDKLIEEDNVVEVRLPKGTGNVLMEKLGLKGKQLGVVMEALTQKLVDGEIKLDSDFVEEAKKLNA